MSMIERTVVLTGVYAGKTINLRGVYPFTDGELTIRGTEEDVNCEVRNLERNFSAYLKGDPRLNMVVTEPPGTGGERTNPADPNSPLAGGAAKPPEGDDHGKRDLSPEGPADADGQGAVLSDVQPDGRGPDAPAADAGAGSGDAPAGPEGGLPPGDGQPALLNVGNVDDPKHAPEGSAKPERNERLLRAVLQLDEKDDTHWTQDGKPALLSVSKFYGSAAVTRADVEAIAPTYRRGQPKPQ